MKWYWWHRLRFDLTDWAIGIAWDSYTDPGLSVMLQVGPAWYCFEIWRERERL